MLLRRRNFQDKEERAVLETPYRLGCTKITKITNAPRVTDIDVSPLPLARERFARVRAFLSFLQSNKVNFDVHGVALVEFVRGRDIETELGQHTNVHPPLLCLLQKMLRAETRGMGRFWNTNGHALP